MIYVLANANTVSGGPELLHQCCFELNRNGFEASMVYFDKTKFPTEASDIVREKYARYKCPRSLKIDDKEENVMILPEAAYYFLHKFKKMRIIFWWLSVDNYFASQKSKYACFYSIFGIKKYNVFDEKYIHCCQSEYAKKFLADNGVKNNVLSLSDYLSKEFIDASKDEQNIEKNNMVLFNPKKGVVFTQELVKHAPDIKWIPLQGYSREEMADLMKRTKVYIDFGNHPGKDRIPREAAMCGCCIITSRSGAAENDIDVPLKEEYKFDIEEDNTDMVISKIKECFNDYEMKRKDFDEYREKIKKEFENFVEEIIKLGELVTKENG